MAAHCEAKGTDWRFQVEWTRDSLPQDITRKFGCRLAENLECAALSALWKLVGETKQKRCHVASVLRRAMANEMRVEYTSPKSIEPRNNPVKA